MARALWARRAGRGTAALRHLQQAVSIGARTGLARSILDYGPAVPPLLEQLLQSETFPPESQAHLAILNLLGRTGAETRISPWIAGAAARNPFRHQDFTDREREVLRLLAKRLSNREIAQRICVTENTVKFHLKNILLKLGVKRRLEVVSALEEMNG